MLQRQKIAPCLWFDNEAEEAVQFYLGIFAHSRIVKISRYGQAGYEIHHKPAGSVLTIEFELNGQLFTALNGGPAFHFNEAISLQVFCDTQQEIDHYWQKLGHNGDLNAQQCGWLKDKYGVSWQIVPTILTNMISAPDHQKSERVMAALLQMKKIDMEKLNIAFNYE